MGTKSDNLRKKAQAVWSEQIMSREHYLAQLAVIGFGIHEQLEELNENLAKIAEELHHKR